METLTKPRVLVVEDDPVNAFVLKRYLEGYAIDVATSPKMAIEFFSSYSYQLVLLDINLGSGQTNGMELMKQMKVLQPNGPKKYIAVTSYNTETDRLSFLQQGFNDHFSKPVDKQRLMKVLKSIENSMVI